MPAGATVRWRFLTKDWRHVMMRWANSTPTDRGGNQQDWGYVWSDCFNFTGKRVWTYDQGN